MRRVRGVAGLRLECFVQQVLHAVQCCSAGMPCLIAVLVCCLSVPLGVRVALVLPFIGFTSGVWLCLPGAERLVLD